VRDYFGPTTFLEVFGDSFGAVGLVIDDITPITIFASDKVSYVIALVIFIVASLITPFIILFVAKRA